MATVVFGPMGAGKSTELYRRACCAALGQHNHVVVITPSDGFRSDEERAGAAVIYTHRGVAALPSNVRVVHSHDKRFDSRVILHASPLPTHVFIDELQFFEPDSLCDGIDHVMRDLPHLKLVLFGLRTDCEGRMWTTSQRVIRIAGKIKTLSAVCGVARCPHAAHFTGLRCAESLSLTESGDACEHFVRAPEQGSVPGGMSKYVPLCYHHMQHYLDVTGGAIAATTPTSTRDP
jgi:thymidine kinase